MIKTKLKLKGRVTYANAVRDTETHTRPFKMSPVLSRQPSLNSAFPPGLGSRHKGEHASLVWTWQEQPRPISWITVDSFGEISEMEDDTYGYLIVQGINYRLGLFESFSISLILFDNWIWDENF